MKKLFAMLIAFIVCVASTTAFADSPTCIMLRFSNNTRYKNIDSASVLSDFVIEKLLASGKFNFKETKPIDEDIKARLYDVKTRELLNLTTGLQNKNLNALFEGQGFNETLAQTIDTAEVGQVITPSITTAIANQHGAEYIIQGTVINMGSGKWGSVGIFGNASFYTDNADMKTAGISIETDLRVIKASTGEIVWRKIVTGKKTTKSYNVGKWLIGVNIDVGKDKITSDLYDKAMDDAAQKIADALIEDLDAGNLFAR